MCIHKGGLESVCKEMIMCNGLLSPIKSGFPTKLGNIYFYTMNVAIYMYLFSILTFNQKLKEH